MAGKKRTSEEAGVSTRSGGAKAVKTSPESKKGKRGPKAIAASAFKSRALPLHVNVTHTPPAIAEDEPVVAINADPGFLGHVALQPNTFSTGSYGWKGSKRLVVELPDPEGGDNKEKVHVMLSINATVIGSKRAEKDGAEGDAGAEGEDDAAHATEGNGEAHEDVKEGEGEATAADE